MTNWPAFGPFHQVSKAKPPVSRTDLSSSHEFSVSCAWTSSSPSLLENRASSASSIETRVTIGVGSCARARPSTATSSPSPNWTVTRISPVIRTKLVKLIPAATQYSPWAGGTSARMSCSSCIGSGGGPGGRTPADVAGDREALDVDLPRRRREERPRDVVAEAQLVDRGGQAEQRDLAVEVEADDLQAAGRDAPLVVDAQPDLVEGNGAEG